MFVVCGEKLIENSSKSHCIEGGINGYLQKWTIESKEMVQSYDGHCKEIICLQFDETQLLSGSADKTLRLFDLQTGT